MIDSLLLLKKNALSESRTHDLLTKAPDDTNQTTAAVDISYIINVLYLYKMIVTLEFNNTPLTRQLLAQTLTEVCQVRLLKLVYTVAWRNIIQGSVTYNSVTYNLPDGLYNIALIQKYFTDNTINAQITLNQATGKIQITTDKAMTITFATMLGFTSNSFTVGTTTATNIPTLLFKNINIALNEVNSYKNILNQYNSSVLSTIRNTSDYYGSTVEYEPQNPYFVSLNSSVLNYLEISMKDESGNNLLQNNIYFKAILEII